MGMTLLVFAGGGSLPAFEHASQRRCLRVCNRGRRLTVGGASRPRLDLDDGGGRDMGDCHLVPRRHCRGLLDGDRASRGDLRIPLPAHLQPGPSSEGAGGLAHARLQVDRSIRGARPVRCTHGDPAPAVGRPRTRQASDRRVALLFSSPRSCTRSALPSSSRSPRSTTTRCRRWSRRALRGKARGGCEDAKGAYGIRNRARVSTSVSSRDRIARPPPGSAEP